MRLPPMRTWPWRDALAGVFFVLFLLELLALAAMLETML